MDYTNSANVEFIVDPKVTAICTRPDYLQSLFSQCHSVYNSRDSEGKLMLPKPNTNYLKRSFSYSGAMLWNNLSKCLKNAVSVNNFKGPLQYLFRPLLGKNEFAVTQHMYAFIGPNLDNIH